MALSSASPLSPEVKKKRFVLNPENSVSWKDVNQVLRDSYNFEATNDSTILDILALYLKGQKIIYMESKTLCEKRLNTLMLPAIFIAAVCSILNFILKEYMYGTIIISSLNAFNSFLLSLISYLKLDGKAEAHKTSAYKFQKLESRCEFNSGKSLFFKDSVDVCHFANEIEKEVMEIRESNQFIIPERIRVMYPTMCETNVFSLVKQIQNDEILIINNLKRCVQALHDEIKRRDQIRQEIEKQNEKIEKLEYEMILCNKEDDSKENKEMKENIIFKLNEHRMMLADLNEALTKSESTMNSLDDQKDIAFTDAVNHRNKYISLSETYKTEIDAQNNRRHEQYCCWSHPLDWCKT